MIYRNGLPMGGIIEDINAWIQIRPTEKATTAAQEKVLSFADQWGLTSFLPQRTTAPGATPATIMQGVDPKLLWLVGGTLGAIIIFTAMKKHRK
jgi:hypothetical protein